jgi:hypothetical protein
MKTAYQNLQYAEKVPRGKFIVINVYIKKKEKLKINTYLYSLTN